MTKINKILVSAFIVLNFLTMVRIFVPLEAKYFATIYRPVDSYLSFFSIYQDWMMFAPNPGRLNTTVEAEVEFDDGSVEKFSFPKQSEMGLFEKYTYGEKYRKIVSEGIRKDENSFMWKDTAKFVLRQLKEKNFSKIPLKVHLIRKWNEIPDVSKEFIPASQSPKSFEQFKFYTYEVI